MASESWNAGVALLFYKKRFFCRAFPMVKCHDRISRVCLKWLSSLRLQSTQTSDYCRQLRPIVLSPFSQGDNHALSASTQASPASR